MELKIISGGGFVSRCKIPRIDECSVVVVSSIIKTCGQEDIDQFPYLRELKETV